MAVTFIESIDDPRLDPYRDLKSHRLRQRSGAFIAEGAGVVRRLVESGLTVRSILVSGRHADDPDPWLPAGIERFVVPRKLASELVGYKFHSGVIACGQRPPSCGLEQLAGDSGSPRIVVACSGIVDPENTGGIIRACAAFGAGGVLLGEGCSDPFSRRVLRVSMGNAFRLPIRESRSLRTELAALRDDHGFQLAATVLDTRAEPLERAAGARRLVLLFGNEARGLEPDLIGMCGRRITVPMRGGTDSLNVAAASAVFLYHFTRSS